MSSPEDKARVPDYRKRPRRFAPLNPDLAQVAKEKERDGREKRESWPRLRGIVFDVDGTLCLPQNHMFHLMRQTLHIQKPTDILTHIHSLPLTPPSPPEEPTPLNHRPTAEAAIRAIERSVMTTQTPQPGLLDLMSYLQKRGVRKGLCTRNFKAPVQHLREKFMPGIEFDPVITRESVVDGIEPKPSPMGVWRCGEVWLEEERAEQGEKEKPDEEGDGEEQEASKVLSEGKDKETDPLEFARRHFGAGLIMVGDSLDDMAAGYRAGAATILLASEETEEELLNGHEHVDLVVKRLDEIIPVLEGGFEGRS